MRCVISSPYFLFSIPALIITHSPFTHWNKIKDFKAKRPYEISSISQDKYSIGLIIILRLLRALCAFFAFSAVRSSELKHGC